MKYRLWDKKNNWMCNDDDVHILPDGSVRELVMGKGWEQCDYYKTTDQYVPLFYTGLRDKNGREIYEGDIVESKDFRKGLALTYKQPTRREAVTYLGSIGRWEFGNSLFSYKPEQYEVIGNIYENPELLNP